MNSPYKQCFDYLLEISNGKMTLTPEQLSKVIDISAKQQSLLRQQGKFPIPHKTIGRRVFYNLLTVLNYLLNGEQEEVQKEEVVVERKVKQPKQKNTNDLSHIFMMKSFSSLLEEKIEQLSTLKFTIDKAINYIEMQQELSSKKTTQKIIKKC